MGEEKELSSSELTKDEKILVKQLLRERDWARRIAATKGLPEAIRKSLLALADDIDKLEEIALDPSLSRKEKGEFITEIKEIMMTAARYFYALCAQHGQEV